MEKHPDRKLTIDLNRIESKAEQNSEERNKIVAEKALLAQDEGPGLNSGLESIQRYRQGNNRSIFPSYL